MNELVVPELHVTDGKVFANSRDIAEAFGKRHAHVLRDISTLCNSVEVDQFMAAEPKSGLSEPWFYPDHYYDPTGRKLLCYNMTKDGFTLLVMGYTGSKALKFKLAYIKRFNEMEEHIRLNTPSEPSLPDFRNPAAAARAWADAIEIAQERQQLLIEAAPKVEAYDNFHDGDGLINITSAGSTIHLTARELNKKLEQDGIYKKNCKRVRVPKDKYVKELGYFEIKNIHSSTGNWSTVQTLVTPSGLQWIQERYGR